MADIVNLRQWRKRRARSEAEEKASQNRAKFGQSKTEKTRQEFSKTQANSHLDQHQLDNKPDNQA
jgi:Domain of unknown function (DUF4169)